MLAAVPACRRRCSAPPPPTAARSAASRGQSVADFYRGRNDYPLWLAPNCGRCGAAAADAPVDAPSIDGLDPSRVSRRRAAAGARRCARAASASTSTRPTGCCPTPSSLMSTICGRIRASGSPMSMPSLRPTPPTPLAALLTAAAAPSLRDYVQSIGLDAPDLRPASRGARQSQLFDRPAARDARAQPRARAGASCRQAALRPRQRRAAAALHVRGRQAGRFDGRGGRQAQMADADARPPTSATPRSILIGTCRPISPARTSGQYVVKYGLKYLDEYGYEVVSDWTPQPDDHRSQDDRLEGRRRRQGRGHDPPEAGTARTSWGG